jgi:endonuclease YncB( thermonuclease family)
MLGVFNKGSQTRRHENVVPFTRHASRRRALPWWSRRTNRQFVLLCALWSGMGCAVYIQAYGLSLPGNPTKGLLEPAWRTSIPICGIGRRTTCLVDGDTGWEDGRKWRLSSIDTPELSSPECSAEYSTALLARDRLAALMSSGYRVLWSGRYDKYDRALVDIELSTGQSAAQVLLDEGLAQGWPNVGNIWCSR